MPDSTIVPRLDSYRDEGLHQVTGWFDDESADVIASLLGLQLDWDVAGEVVEIGVHHGKSFLLLANGTREHEHAIAVDVFGDQEKNLDRSGLGDRVQFETNAATWAANAQLVIHQCSSLEILPSEAVKTFGPVRMFSIDGGHTAEITAHDLRLAEACVVEEGIVVLDDVLNAHWLGVLSGLSDYLSAEHVLRPFAFSSNKLYLAPTASAAERYAKALREVQADLLGKQDVEFFGGSIDVYGQGSPRRRAAAADAGEARRAEQDSRDRTARELKRANARVQELTSSTSWRVTAGPRALSKALRTGRRRVSSARPAARRR